MSKLTVNCCCKPTATRGCVKFCPRWLRSFMTCKPTWSAKVLKLRNNTSWPCPQALTWCKATFLPDLHVTCIHNAGQYSAWECSRVLPVAFHNADAFIQ